MEMLIDILGITTLIIIYLFVSISVFTLTLVGLDLNTSFLTPNKIYKTGRVNYFGALMISIFVNLVAPYFFIYGFIKWLFTIGR